MKTVKNEPRTTTSSPGAGQSLRILFLADTHLGYDLPFRPRVERRRRGHDFFANYERALAPAVRGEVDLVVHGGDLFFRTRVPPLLVEMALEPLAQIAKQGTLVFLVPGNHERSRIPGHLLAAQPNLFIFHRPETFLFQIRSQKVAISGFPFHRQVGEQFEQLLDQTGYLDVEAGIRLLCLHQAVEGAIVGPANFTFRRGPDVIPGRSIPPGFTAVLSGHIHRAQTLTHDLAGRLLAAPVIYPGSIERTAFAERHEDKCYVKLEIRQTTGTSKPLLDIKFIKLPARPMVVLALDGRDKDFVDLHEEIGLRLQDLPPDAVVRLDLAGPLVEGVEEQLSAAWLRSLARPTMNVNLGRLES